MTSHLSIRVPTDLAERLERLARATAQSKSTLAVEALETYLALQKWQIEAIPTRLAGARCNQWTR